MDRNDQSSKLFIPVSILLGATIIAWAIMANSAPKPAGTVAAVQNAPAPVIAVDATKVSLKDSPMIGNPNAPVTIAYWYDYQCPFCQRSEETLISSLVKEYVETGKAKIVFKDLQFLGPDSLKLGTIGRAVWEIAPTKYYAWHKTIFDNQGQENSGWATDAFILTNSTKVLGATDAARAVELAKQKADIYKKLLEADIAEGERFGIVRTTPNMIIGKVLVTGAQPYEQVKTIVEDVLSGK